MGRRAARKNVVDQPDPRRRFRRRAIGVTGVATSFWNGETSLAWPRAGAREQRFGGQVPEARQLAGQALGRVVPATEAALAVRRHKGEHPHGWAVEPIRDDLRSQARQMA